MKSQTLWFYTYRLSSLILFCLFIHSTLQAEDNKSKRLNYSPPPMGSICFDETYDLVLNFNTWPRYITTIEENAGYNVIRRTSSISSRSRFEEIAITEIGEQGSYRLSYPSEIGNHNKTRDGNFTVTRIENDEVFIRKGARNGTITWSQTVDLQIDGALQVREAIEDDMGNFFVRGFVSEDNGGTPPSLTFFVIKINSAGDLAWQYTEAVEDLLAGLSTHDLADRKLKPDDNGGCFVLMNRSNDTEWILRLDDSGQRQWFQTVGNASNQPYDIAAGDNGRLLHVMSTYISYFDAMGSTLWQITLPDIDLAGIEAYGAAATATSDGNFMMVIYGDSTLLFGKSRLHIVKIDSDGNLIWRKFLKEYPANVTFPYLRLHQIQETRDNGFLITSDFGRDIHLMKTNENGELCVTPPSIACPDNILDNADYEDPVASNAWIYSAAVQMTDDASSGNQAIQICGIEPGKITQTQAVRSGGLIQGKVFAKRSGSEGTAFIGYKFLTAQGLPTGDSGKFIIDNTDYEEQEFVLFTPANASYIKIRAGKSAGDACLFIDNWCIQDFGDDEVSYCDANADFPWEEWISGVKVDTVIDQSSGKSTYTEYAPYPYPLTKGVDLPLELSATFSYQTYDEYWRVWIDLDQDGNFESNELLYEDIMLKGPAGLGVTQSLQANLMIPTTATKGRSKMRVIMSRNQYAPSCGTIDFGEVEDYEINIISDGTPIVSFTQPVQTIPDFRVFPNPAKTYTTLDLEKFEGLNLRIEVYDQLGRLHWQKGYEAAPARESLELSTWHNGNYIIRLIPQEGETQVSNLLLLGK